MPQSCNGCADEYSGVMRRALTRIQAAISKASIESWILDVRVCDKHTGNTLYSAAAHANPFSKVGKERPDFWDRLFEDVLDPTNWRRRLTAKEVWGIPCKTRALAQAVCCDHDLKIIVSFLGGASHAQNLELARISAACIRDEFDALDYKFRSVRVGPNPISSTIFCM